MLTVCCKWPQNSVYIIRLFRSLTDDTKYSFKVEYLFVNCFVMPCGCGQAVGLDGPIVPVKVRQNNGRVDTFPNGMPGSIPGRPKARNAGANPAEA